MNEIVSSILILGLAGFVFALVLAFLSRRLKVEEDPHIEEVLSVLPGLNCGACGFSSCRTFAEAVVRECKLFSGCLLGGKEVNEKIAKILGVVGGINKSKEVVLCHCGAEEFEKKSSCVYLGPETCRAAHIVGGGIDCLYGCLAFGDCLAVCPTQALTIENKKVYVDIEKCIGCGNCVRICSRKLFELILRNGNGVYYVACNNKDKLASVKKVCTRGCIGCGICTRVDNSPYYLSENLARLDRNKIDKKEPLEEAKIKCPTRCILSSPTPTLLRK